jgi:hypothetical protein
MKIWQHVAQTNMYITATAFNFDSRNYVRNFEEFYLLEYNAVQSVKGAYRLHLQGRRISRARNQRESRSIIATRRFHADLIEMSFKFYYHLSGASSVSWVRWTKGKEAKFRLFIVYRF